MDTMEKRIEAQTEGRAPQEVLKLNLDNCEAEQIEGLTGEYINLTSLSLVNIGLKSLKGFPKLLPKLKKLDLSDNRISGELELLSGCPNLTYLNLSGNQIKDVDTLQPLKSLENLRTLDLFNCEVTNGDGYKEKVFDLLGETLLFLDGFDKNGEEADVEDGAEDSEEDDEDDDDDDDEVGLEYLQKPGLEDESEGDDFAPGDDDNEADELDEEDSEEGSLDDGGARGVKRKRGDDDDDDESKDG